MERRELESWIAATQRNQRRLTRLLIPAALASVALVFWRPAIGGIGLGIVAIFAICGFWILSSHLADWRGKLAQLDRPRGTGRAGRPR